MQLGTPSAQEVRGGDQQQEPAHRGHHCPGLIGPESYPPAPPNSKQGM